VLSQIAVRISAGVTVRPFASRRMRTAWSSVRSIITWRVMIIEVSNTAMKSIMMMGKRDHEFHRRRRVVAAGEVTDVKAKTVHR
jgi:hypothetical protein